MECKKLVIFDRPEQCGKLAASLSVKIYRKPKLLISIDNMCVYLFLSHYSWKKTALHLFLLVAYIRDGAPISSPGYLHIYHYKINVTSGHIAEIKSALRLFITGYQTSEVKNRIILNEIVFRCPLYI